MDKNIMADPKDLLKDDPTKLLQEREELEKKINDKKTPWNKKLALSAKLFKLDNKIAKCDIGKFK